MIEVSEFSFGGSTYVERRAPDQSNQLGRASRVRGTALTHERPAPVDHPGKAPDVRRGGHGVLEVVGATIVTDDVETDIE